VPRRKRIDFGDLRRFEPFSVNYGYDRGTPLDRYYIERFFRQHRRDIRGSVLEIEQPLYSRWFGKPSEVDVLHVVEGSAGATIIADLSDAPQIASNAYDCIVLPQTLQYIFDTRAAIRTLYRILKPRGVLLATMPGLSRTSDFEWSDSWYWNFTSRSAKRLFAEQFGARNVRVAGHGNLFIAAAFLYGVVCEEVSKRELDRVDEGFEISITVRAVKAR
jgi:SAM-dependent methyltransferase